MREASPSPARRREAQGRLFWVWLLTLPILLLRTAALAFGSAWPNPLTQRIAMVMLAFPVLFVVGEPMLADAAAAWRARRPSLALLVASSALACYASGVLAVFTAAPPVAGASAVIVATYLTLRYVTGRY